MEHEELLTGLMKWYRSPLGRYVHSMEQKQLQQILPRFFGYNLLQISLNEICFDLSASPIRERYFINNDNCRPSQAPSVRGLSGELPFRANTFDVVLLPHVLEFIVEPDKILEEATRVIIPEGHLILFGFNPFSIWGLSRFWKARQQHIPWAGNFISATEVQNWLTAYDFEIELKEYMVYRSPSSSLEEDLANESFFEKVSHKCWPRGGAIYIMLAKKKVFNMIPIRQAWKDKVKIKAKGVVDTLQRVKRG